MNFDEPRIIENIDHEDTTVATATTVTSRALLIDGWMRKKGRRTNCWKRRYFKLYGDGTLEYYLVEALERGSATTRGFINLSSAVRCIQKSKCLHIRMRGQKTLKFKLKTNEERNAWYQAIASLRFAPPSPQSTGCEPKGQEMETDDFAEIEPLPVALRDSPCKIRRTSSISAMMSRTKSFITGRFSRSQTLCIDTRPFTKDLTASGLLASWNEDGSQSLLSLYNKLTDVIKLENQQSSDDPAVRTLVVRMESEISENIGDMVHLMRCNEQMLIETLKICEMEQFSTNQILTHSYSKWVEWKNHGTDGPQQTERVHRSNQSMRFKAFSKITDEVIIATRKLKGAESLKECWKAIAEISQNVDYLNHCIDLKFPPNVTAINAPYPPHYHAINFYVERCYERMALILIDKLDSTQTEFADVLSSVSRIEAFMAKMDRLRNDSKMENAEMILSALRRRQRALSQRYTDRLAVKWLLWVYNIVQTEVTKREYFMADGVPRVHCVQDLFTMFNQFGAGDKYALWANSELFHAVTRLIGKTVDAFAIMMEADIDRNGMRFDDDCRYFCALINSMGEIVAALERYRVKMGWDQEFEHRIDRLRKWTKQSAVLLSHKIVEDALRRNVFDVLFTTQYFKNGKSTDVAAMVQTVKEYLEDFSEWIEEEWVLQEIRLSLMGLCTDEYIQSLIRQCPTQEISVLAQNIESDVETMKKFFGDETIFDDGRFQESWKEKYRYLEAIHGALTSEDGLVFIVHSKRLKSDELFGSTVFEYIQERRKLFRITYVYDCLLYLTGCFWWETTERKSCADSLV